MSADVVGAGGPVAVGPVAFHVLPLTVREEAGLLARLRRRAKEAMGPGSYYTNAQPTLAWLAANGLHADRAVLLAEVARLVATAAPVSDDAAYDYRQTPDGVAEELFVRTRQTHPAATLEELKAVVTDFNAADVFHQMLAAVSGPKPAGG